MTGVHSPGLHVFSEHDFEVHHKLGEGSYGAVHKVRVKKTGEWLAIKKIGQEWYDYGMPASTLREIGTLLHLGAHPNLVALRGVMTAHEGEMLLCFELSTGGDLSSKLDELCTRSQDSASSQGVARVPGGLAVHIIREVSKGLAYLHAHDVIHRDVKPMNVLVDPGCTTLKICDFGMARYRDVPDRLMSREAMTVYYRPPEVLFSAVTYGAAADVWSAGAMFAEVLCRGCVLFECDTEVELMVDIFKTLGTPGPDTWPGVTALPDYQPCFPRFNGGNLRAKPYMNDVPASAYDLLEKMLVCCPERRIAMAEVLAHPYLANGQP